MCDLKSLSAVYSRFGVLMVYLCRFRPKTGNEVHTVYPAKEHISNGVLFSTASRLQECLDPPSEDEAFLLRLPCERR